MTNDLHNLSEQVEEFRKEMQRSKPEKQQPGPEKLIRVLPAESQDTGPKKPTKQQENQPKRSRDKDPCFICNNIGHQASECPEKENFPAKQTGENLKKKAPRIPNLNRESAVQNKGEPSIKNQDRTKPTNTDTNYLFEQFLKVIHHQ